MQPAGEAGPEVTNLARARSGVCAKRCAWCDSIHQAGVVHRDVKPDNVILTADEEPKLLDFGIAKAVDAHTDTHQDTVLGTPKFMAPEQANDHSKVGPPTRQVPTNARTKPLGP